eukprot:SAG31_NODE_11632_length_1011_cov_1.293860_2_plen_94_part_00
MLGRDDYGALLGAGESQARGAAEGAVSGLAKNVTVDDMASGLLLLLRTPVKQLLLMRNCFLMAVASAFKDVPPKTFGDVAYDPDTADGAASLV